MYWCVRNVTANTRQCKFLHFDRCKNKLKFCCIVPLKEKQLDPWGNYKTVSLEMQVFVVFIQAQRFGQQYKKYIYIHEWTSRWFLLVHFPEPWGDAWIIAVVCVTTSFPESLNSTSSVERERGWLSISKLINNSCKENKNRKSLP